MSKQKTIRLEVSFSVEIPRVPNYLMISDTEKVPLCAVTEEGLRDIGAAWTEKLIARMRAKRMKEAGLGAQGPISREAPDGE